MPANAVTVDRQKLMDLLVEAHAVESIFTKLAGASSSPLTGELLEKAEAVAAEFLGEPLAVPNWTPEMGDAYMPCPRVNLWDAGDRAAREFFGELDSEAVTPDAC